jgi:hypothetical protein
MRAIRGAPSTASRPDVSRRSHRTADVVKTARERAEEKRQAKLDVVREQVDSGSLVIRPMTEEERRRYPPRPVQPKRLRKQ